MEPSFLERSFQQPCFQIQGLPHLRCIEVYPRSSSQGPVVLGLQRRACRRSDWCNPLPRLRRRSLPLAPTRIPQTQSPCGCQGRQRCSRFCGGGVEPPRSHREAHTCPFRHRYVLASPPDHMEKLTWFCPQTIHLPFNLLTSSRAMAILSTIPTPSRRQVPVERT